MSMFLAPVVKAVRAYDATEWEIFIREWQKGLKQYHSVKRLGGAGDLGRDVIGLCSPQGCKGEWDNYQCKHYESPLSLPKAVEDAGKIIFHAFQGKFVPPRKYYFVAPRGPSTELREMLLNPDEFRAEVIKTWDARVSKRVVSKKSFPLEGDLLAFVSAYDYTSFTYSTLDDILDDHRKTAYWAGRFNGFLPAPPVGKPPVQIAAKEAVYVRQLLDVYEDDSGTPFSDIVALEDHRHYVEDLQRQRIRFYDAEEFIAHYRGETEPGTIEDFAEQIFDMIDPHLSLPKAAYSRLMNSLSAAGTGSVVGVLAPQAKPRIKQGFCHQLANDGRVVWKP